MASTTFQLSPAESEALRILAQRTGKTEEELMHEAVANLLRQANHLAAWQQAVQDTQGMWRDRNDLPDFDKLRVEGNRYPTT